MLAVPAFAQEATTGGVMALPIPIPDGRLGFTFCRAGLAESWIRADIVGTPEAEEILAHEAVHRAQAAAFPRCEDYVASLNSARRIIESEIPAYCVQWRLVTGRGLGIKPDSLRWDYVLRISAESGAMENRLDVLRLFEGQCQ